MFLQTSSQRVCIALMIASTKTHVTVLWFEDLIFTSVMLKHRQHSINAHYQNHCHSSVCSSACPSQQIAKPHLPTEHLRTRPRYQKQKQKKTIMISVGRDSVNSQEDSWSSNEPLMANSEKDTEDRTRNVPQRKAQHVWPFLLHVLIFTSYSVAFLTATSFWTYQEFDRSVAYCPSYFRLSECKDDKLTFRSNSAGFRSSHIPEGII